MRGTNLLTDKAIKSVKPGHGKAQLTDGLRSPPTKKASFRLKMSAEARSSGTSSTRTRSWHSVEFLVFSCDAHAHPAWASYITVHGQ